MKKGIQHPGGYHQYITDKSDEPERWAAQRNDAPS